jgi:hypothetical protein
MASPAAEGCKAIPVELARLKMLRGRQATQPLDYWKRDRNRMAGTIGPVCMHIEPGLPTAMWAGLLQ